VSERAYTVKELDELRSAVRWRLLSRFPPGTYSFDVPAYIDKRLEEVVRTHMLAGHAADDVKAATRADGDWRLERGQQAEGAPPAC
jgi:hypothetical protein